MLHACFLGRRVSNNQKTVSVLEILKYKAESDVEVENRKLSLEEKKLALEERKIALQESQFQLEKVEREGVLKNLSNVVTLN